MVPFNTLKLVEGVNNYVPHPSQLLQDFNFFTTSFPQEQLLFFKVILTNSNKFTTNKTTNTICIISKFIFIYTIIIYFLKLIYI